MDARVEVAVDEDGSGTLQTSVTLDREAVASLGGGLEDRLKVEDLREAGWRVDVEEGPRGARVVAAKPFERAEALAGVVAELSGPAGPFRAFRLERHAGAFRNRFEFTGRVDLGEGVARSALDPGDEGLAAALATAEVDTEELAAFLGERIDDAFHLEVRVGLPGGGDTTWRPAGSDAVELSASSTSLHLARIAALVAGVALALLAAGLATGWVFRFRRP